MKLWSICKAGTICIIFLLHAVVGASQLRLEQQLGTRLITIDDGLPSNRTVGLFEDRKGYLWVATGNAGICSYNGREFKSHGIGDGLGDLAICNTTEDEDGNLFVLSATAAHTRTSTGYKQVFKLPQGFNCDYFSWLLVMSDCYYIFNVFSRNKKNVQGMHHLKVSRVTGQFSFVREWQNNDLIRPFPHKAGSYLLFTRSGAIYLLKPSGQSILYGSTIGNITDVIDTHDGSFLAFSNEQGGKFIQIKHDAIPRLGFKTFTLFSFPVYVIPMKRLLTRRQNGEILFCPNNDTLYTITSTAAIPKGSVPSGVYDVFTDKRNNTWIATSLGVKAYFNFSFVTYSAVLPSNKRVPILSAFPDNDNGIRFSVLGLGLWKWADTSKTLLQIMPTQIGGLKRKDFHLFLEQQVPSCMAPDGTSYFNSQQRIWKWKSKKVSFFAPANIMLDRMICMPNGQLVGMSGYGLYYINQNEIRELTYDELSRNELYDLAVMPNDQLLIATANGVFSLANGAIHDIKSLRSFRPYNVEVLSKKHISFLSAKGIGIYDQFADTLYIIGEGLFSELPINQIVYKNRFLVIRSDRQLAVFNVEHFIKTGVQKWLLFDKNNGLPTGNLQGANWTLGPNGQLLLPLVEGVLSFHPDSLRWENNMPESTVVSNVLESNNKLLWTSCQQEGSKFIMNRVSSNLQLVFDATTVGGPSKVFYQYKFSNKKQTVWSLPTLEPSATFYNVEPGNYSFVVKSSFDGVNWKTCESEISILVLPLWHETIWAKVLAVIIVLTIAIGIWRHLMARKLRSVEIKNQMERLVFNERQRISAELHDDVTAEVSALSLQAQMSILKANDNDARNVLTVFNYKVNELKQKISDVVWALDDERNSVTDLTFFITKQANLLFENSKCNLQIQNEIERPEARLSSIQKRNIYLVTKEALHNLLKHADATEAILTILQKDEILNIYILDNGRGFDAKSLRSMESFGIRNMHQRMKAINGHLNIKSPNSGTLVEISLKLSN